jgi:hypothetical protein
MTQGFLIYEEMRKYLAIYCTRRPLVIYDFATASFWISLYIRKFIFSFLSVWSHSSRKLVTESKILHFARAISGPKKVSIFRAHPFQCPL